MYNPFNLQSLSLTFPLQTFRLDSLVSLIIIAELIKNYHMHCSTIADWRQTKYPRCRRYISYISPTYQWSAAPFVRRSEFPAKSTAPLTGWTFNREPFKDLYLYCTHKYSGLHLSSALAGKIPGDVRTRDWKMHFPWRWEIYPNQTSTITGGTIPPIDRIRN